MVEFMERNGDLSKPSGGPRGRQWCIKKWQELITKLNSEGTGDSRTEEKWRKVWSDFKNNTKKKYAKINRAAHGTGGGPALRVTLTDLEERVMAIIGQQSATGLPIAEAGLQQDQMVVIEEFLAPIPGHADTETEILAEEVAERPSSALPFKDDIDWNMPGPSSQPTPRPSIPSNSETEKLPEVDSIPQRLPSPPPKPASQWKPSKKN